MARKPYGVPAFAGELEFNRFVTYLSRLARGKRAELANELGVSKQTLSRLSSDQHARVLADTRAALEVLLARTAGIVLTAPPASKLSPEAERKPRSQQEDAGTGGGNSALVMHLKDALLEAVAACGDAKKLAAALQQLLA